MKDIVLLFPSCAMYVWSSTFHHATMKNNERTSMILNLMPQQLGQFEPLLLAKSPERKVQLLDLLNDDLVDFEEGWELQKGLLQDHLNRISCLPDRSQFCTEVDHFQFSRGLDSILFLQHKPVYTLGTVSDESFILSNDAAIPVIRMDRGGEVTYHGPGQLTVYPILDLRGYKQDIHWYIRALEEVVIRALATLGVDATRQDGVTGVWINGVKVAAIGIKCRRWVTMHGIAVNVEASSLLPFQGIVACGLEGRKVGYLNQFLSSNITVFDFAKVLEHAFEDVFQIEINKYKHQ